ncbi:MAG TPA: xanthine dehydrogenase family protein molybdopterin-binding subunit [Stellaceae bacterium]
MDSLAGLKPRASGRPLPRKEDVRLLTGAGRYADDFNAAGQLYAAFVRSPHPHARIVNIDTAAARASPGVVGIFTGVDCRADNLAPIPHDPVPSTQFDMKLTAPGGGGKDRVFIGPHDLLAVERARHVGEAIAVAIAETRDQAQDAAEAVVVDYEALPFVIDAAAALVPGAPLLYDAAPGNLLIDTRFGDAAATERAFATAAHIFTKTVHVPRASPMPMELRSGLAEYDAQSGRYTLHLTSGGPGVVRQRRQYAAVLGIAVEKLRLVALDVGGSFGARNRPYVEFGLALWAAKKLGRPVKYTATRSEEMITAYEGRDLSVTLELAVGAEGRFLALKASNISNVGAHCVTLSPLAKGCGLITGSYDIAAASLHARAVFTNTVPTTTMRSSGRPEVNFALERLIDAASRALGIDRVELRRRNLVRSEQMPYANAVGTIYDSGDYARAMNDALRIADWAGSEERRKAAAARGRCLGLGLANYVESSTGSPRERAALTVLPEGRVRLVIGTQPSGQGQETSFSQVIADLLAVPVDSIDVVTGDTDLVGEGGGSHSGRSMRHAAVVMTMASAKLIEEGKRLAARVFDAAPDQIAFEDGRFKAPRANCTLDWFELAKEARTEITAIADNEMHQPVFPNGCAICEIEIDPATGGAKIKRYTSVDDVGRAINPLIVDGQNHGSIAHGVGEALSEECSRDPRTGQSLAGSFMEYGMPHADDLPLIDTEILEILSPTNPLGIKSAGEGPTTAAPAAVVNAIVDALAPLGVTDVPLPALPVAVWRAIEQAKARSRR